MKRKRAKGGGRKPRAGPTSSLTFRIPDDLRRELELEAAEASGGASVSERLLWHLRRDINRKREEERDPALQALLLLIAKLAEFMTGARFLSKDARAEAQSAWRTNLFFFRAFKFAVKKLLDALEEPPASSSIVSEEERDQFRRQTAEKFGLTSEFLKPFLEIRRSPEALGAHAFTSLWTGFTLLPQITFSEAERRIMREDPILGRAMEREYYDFQKARKALELKPKKGHLEKSPERMDKNKALEILPDFKAALKSVDPQMIEAFVKLMSENIAKGKSPNPEEVMKLLKLEKAKDENND
jgi:hypothetical protein